ALAEQPREISRRAERRRGADERQTRGREGVAVGTRPQEEASAATGRGAGRRGGWRGAGRSVPCTGNDAAAHPGWELQPGRSGDDGSWSEAPRHPPASPRPSSTPERRRGEVEAT